MEAEQKKKIATEFWQLLAEGQFDQAQGLLAPDAVFCHRSIGAVPLKAYFPLLRQIVEAVPIHHLIEKVIAEGDDIAIVSVGDGRLPNGVKYNNHYVLLMTVRDQRICSITEYSDTLYARQVLHANLPRNVRESLEARMHS